MKRKISDDHHIGLRQLADQLATDSIVNQALARYLFQILEFAHDEYIEPLQKENAELRHRLAVLGGRPIGSGSPGEKS